MALKKSVVNIVCNDFKNDSRVLKESLSLQKAGADVSVVAFYDDSLPETENIEGVSVFRLKLKLRYLSKNPLGRVFMLLEFLFTIAKRFRKAEILHCNDLNALSIGVFVKILSNRKAIIVYDAHEYETERHSIKPWMKQPLRMLEAFLIRHVDKVITVSDSIAIEYTKLYGIEKPSLVLNCPAFEIVPRQDRFRQAFGIRSDQTIFLYQGALLGGRGIGLLIDAFSDCDSDRNVIVFMGYGPLEKLIIDAASESSIIFFHPAVQLDILLNYTASADFGVLPYQDTCLNHRYCSPNKIFEYFMAGIPVVVSNLFEMKRLVETYEVGVVAKDNTVQGFQEAIERIHTLNYDHLLKKVDLARKQFNWENQEKVLLDLYRDIA